MDNSQKILIDGYNVIHADPEMKRLLDPSPENARVLLVERLVSYVDQKRLRVTIVFDGRGMLLDAESIIPGKLQILFSRGHQSADELIISTLEEAANPREYLVVTSDNEDIGRVARGLGSQVLSSAAFLSRLKRSGGKEQAPAEDPGLAAEDIEYWLKKFNEE